MKVVRMEIPIYCGALHIVFSEDVQKDKEAINKKFDGSIDNKSDFCAQTDSRKNHFLVIFNMKNIKIEKDESDLIETIAHEALHLTSFIFNRKGILPDTDNDEPQAYLLGWLSAQIYKTYLKFKHDKTV